MANQCSRLGAGILLITVLIGCDQSPKESRLQLDQYSVTDHQQYTVEGVDNNLSGITYSHETDTLFAVVDAPSKIIELGLDGKTLRVIELVNFTDTEGITHIGDGYYAVTQEQTCQVTFIRITPETTSVDAMEHVSFTLHRGTDSNSCLEGIAWSPSNGLFVANEKLPVSITHLPRPLIAGWGNNEKDLGDILPRHFDELPLSDISGLYVVEDEQRLLVISDESRRLLELDFFGKIHSGLNLYTGLFDNPGIIEQPEGVAMDRQGHIYVVGEPNILLVFIPESS